MAGETTSFRFSDRDKRNLATLQEQLFAEQGSLRRPVKAIDAVRVALAEAVARRERPKKSGEKSPPKAILPE